MKHIYLLLSLVSVCLTVAGQTPLPESRRSSDGVLVYKLTKNDMRKLFLREEEPDESMLHSFVMSCPVAGEIPDLPRGNYIIVSVRDNRLNYSVHTADNFHHNLVTGEKVMLMLSDTLGNVITGAKVKCGIKKLRFDAATNTYNTRQVGDEKLVEADNDGVLHYIVFEDRSYNSKFNLRSRWRRMKYSIPSKAERFIEKLGVKEYKGFVVFSKPRYKPGETVRFKAYVHHKGKPYNKAMNISLSGGYGVMRIDTTLTKLEPYRSGMFEWEFKLTDSLNLRLDNSYWITLGSRYWKNEDLSGSFRYEDYELGRISFTARSDKSSYVKGDTVRVTLKAEDENSMPVYDGSVGIKVRAANWQRRSQFHADEIFVPDLIWEHRFDMEQTSEKEFALPDSLFLNDASMSYQFECVFTDAGNERHSKSFNFFYDVKERAIEQNTPTIRHRFYRDGETVRLVVDNPTGIPLWYAVKKGNRVIKKGYGASLDYSCRNAEKSGYSMQIVYLLDGEVKTITDNLHYGRKNISMEVDTPTIIWPGQTTAVEISVTDRKGHPVKNADVTAYSYTSKFGDANPHVTIYGRSVAAKRFKNKNYTTDEETIRNAKARMDWDVWRERMRLDSIEYYRFLYPDGLYAYSEPESVAQIAPYAVLNGDVQGVHLLWIDGQPHYFSQAQHYQVYSFPVRPGYHTISMRTHDREITLRNVCVEAGTRQILSADCSASTVCELGGDRKPVEITVDILDKKQWGLLTDREMEVLKNSMITVSENSGYIKLLGYMAPTVINTAAGYYYINHDARPTYDHNTKNHTTSPRLVGPFPYNLNAALQSGNRTGRYFMIEGGNNYAIWNDRIKQTKWEYNQIRKTISPFGQDVDFKSRALTPAAIRRMFDNKIFSSLSSRSGYLMGDEYDNNTSCKLSLDLSIFRHVSLSGKPIMIYIASSGTAKPQSSVYFGGTTDFRGLPAGDTEINFIFSDTTRQVVRTALREGGTNYIRVKSAERLPADSLTKAVFAGLDSLMIPDRPNYFSYKEVLDDYFLNIDNLLLDEVVVVGYGVERNKAKEPQYELTGSVAGISFQPPPPLKSSVIDGEPLVIVDGVPVEAGMLSLMDVNSLGSVTVIRGTSETAIYGARASAGVILIDTHGKGTPALLPGYVSAEDERLFYQQQGANSIRTNFSDNAFWQPRLKTDRQGKVKFDVTYPDDITNWMANFIAVGGRKKTDNVKLRVKSFKPLNAQLSAPSFMIAGDSLNVVGRLTNIGGDSLIVSRTINVDGTVVSSRIKIGNSHIDHIPVVTGAGDSIRVEYALQTETGYLDGERRSIAVLPQGVLETHGEFVVLNDTVPHAFATNPELGTVTIYAESSAMGVLLGEIDRIDKYGYLCNEQLASKIKALIAKKRIYSMTGDKFRDDHKINDLIGKLNRNRNDEKMWSWWNRGNTEWWISRHIIEALLDADAEGFKANIDKQATTDALISKLNRDLSRDNMSKAELLDILRLLHRLGAELDYDSYLSRIDNIEDSSLNSRLRMVEAAYIMDVESKPHLDSIVAASTKTLLGSLYWAEPQSKDGSPERLWLPYVNNVDNTLIAYRILRMGGAEESLLASVRNYFFEQRRSGYWRNIYESSRILETILPDMLSDGEPVRTTSVNIDGRVIDKLPYQGTFDAGTDICVRKTGTAPVFVTAYQQSWNADPKTRNEGFEVDTWFECNGKTVAELKSGEPVELKVSVRVDSDAEYVMIEIPVPAGCSYLSKGIENYSMEIHREYYKERVVIFCSLMPKGNHEFTVRLNPRYSGTVHRNPARAELMYFPSVYGRHEINKHVIL